MSYLLCDKCGSYYELQEGESPEDFDLKCACGGELIYSENLEGMEDSNEPETTITCPRCGTENEYNLHYCQECGEKFSRTDKSPKKVLLGIFLGFWDGLSTSGQIKFVFWGLGSALMLVIMIIKMTK